MLGRKRVCLSWHLPALTLAGVGIFAGIPLPDTTKAGDELDRRNRQRTFSHSVHVAQVWGWNGRTTSGRFPEVRRDCRGCHYYGAEDVDAPDHTERPLLQLCTECHYADPESDTPFNALCDDPSRLVDSKPSAFRHQFHLALACRVCHPPTSRGNVPTRMTLIDDFRCDRCHGADPSSLLIVDAALPEPAGTRRDALSEQAQEIRQLPPDVLLLESVYDQGSPPQPRQLDRSRLAGPVHAELDQLVQQSDEPRVFLHAEHIAQDAPAGPACLACHPDIPSTTQADLHHQRFNGTACTECHVALESEHDVAPETTAGTAYASLAFSHAAHLSPRGERDPDLATDEAYDEIDQLQCLACHERTHDVAHDRTDMTLQGLRRRPRYRRANCLRCHQGDQWRTAIPHGTWSMNGCTDCHEVSLTPVDPAQGTEGCSHKTKRLDDGTHLECSSCHQPAQHEAFSSVPSTCVQCHDHDANVAHSGGLESAHLNTCRHCHSEAFPPLGGNVEVERFSARSPHLFARRHPLEGDCGDCHLDAEFSVSDMPHLIATGGYTRSSQRNRVMADVHLDERIRGRVPAAHILAEDIDCLDCHWGGRSVDNFARRDLWGGKIEGYQSNGSARTKSYPGGGMNRANDD